ncbi:MAG: rhomboid family intramembrane serine protease [Vulcanibacillus sp.]
MLTRDYIWSVANNLVKEHGFSMLHVKDNSLMDKQDNLTINLIKYVKGEHIYVRLTPTDYVWPNHINNDLLQVKEKAKQIIEQIKSKKMRFINLYIFNSSPSDEVHQIISQNSRTTDKGLEIYSGYIDLESGKLGINDDTFDNVHLKIEPFVKYVSGETPNDADKMIEEIVSVQENRHNDIKNIFDHGKPLITYSLIIINAIIFLIMTLSGGSTDTEVLIKFGAKESFLIMDGEYWRFITPIFLHIGFVHFAFNNVALYYLGQLTEKIYGSIRFIAIYMLAGIIGNFASFIFSPDTIAAGASGAIFGLFGALLYFGYIYPDLFFKTIGKDILTIIGINLVIGFTISNIDNYAHIGGLVGGFLVAAIIHLPNNKKRKWLVTVISIIVLIGILSLTWVSVTSDDLKGSEAIYITGQQALEKGDLETANKIFSFLVEEYPEQYFFHFYYGNTLLNEGELEQATEQYEMTLEMQNDFPEVYYNLALIYIFNEDFEYAKDLLDKALKIDPNFIAAEELLEQLNQE